MVWKFSILLSLAMGVLGYDHHAISHQSIVQHHSPEHHGHHGELSHIGHHTPEHHEDYAWAYPLYEYSYKVDDPYTYDNKGHQEIRDGDNVKGMYWLIQPDGLKRTVTYYVDKDSGFNAHVEYSDPHHHEPAHLAHHQQYNHTQKSEVYATVRNLPLYFDSHNVHQDYRAPQYEHYYNDY